MFTGIIETTGKVESIKMVSSSKIFWISSAISQAFKIDESVSHDGVCLTVEEIKNNAHRITAIEETLSKSSLNLWKVDDEINLERSMQLNARLDGHIVQGHVDTTANCIDKKDKNGSWEYRFRFAKKFMELIIEKGSVAVNGISLTIFNVTADCFSVAIIPYTFEHTNVKDVNQGSIVNIEFDIIGKYVNRKLNLQNSK